jgi:hypothetical protein
MRIRRPKMTPEEKARRAAHFYRASGQAALRRQNEARERRTRRCARNDARAEIDERRIVVGLLLRAAQKVLRRCRNATGEAGR